MIAPIEKFKGQGLTRVEAEERRKRFGRNELPKPGKIDAFGRLLNVLREPLLILLVLVAGVYFLLGDRTEGMILSCSALLAIGLTYYQDYKAEAALEALRDLSSPRALVVREQKQIRIPAAELVPGDLVVVQEGDRIPADAYLVYASHISIDESVLTGEAFPVKKKTVEDANDSEPGKIFEENLISMGTLVVEGKGYIRVLRTGVHTEVGRIGHGLMDANPAVTFVAREVKRLVWIFSFAATVICLAIVLFCGLLRGEWLFGFLNGLAAAMALMPEEFPVIMTVFFALGAWRLSKENVLVRRPSATERLGAISVLCVDKTGTITENKMSVAALAAGGKIRQSFFSLAPEKAETDVLRYAALASQPRPFDPMEKAVQAAAKIYLPEQKALTLALEYPLSKELLATTFAWTEANGSKTLATKGAPEAVLGLCALTATDLAREMEVVNELAARGLRVLGVAAGTCVGELPTEQRALSLRWLGLIAFEDPVRPEVLGAVELCKQAGIQVLMITGDYPATAKKVAEEAGLGSGAKILTGAALDGISDEELVRVLPTIQVFARMRPEQKLRIVRALQSRGEVVGMTGDGVNDAPSLKRADVGIAMGARGTDVAREAADIVLVDDNFASIVSGVRRGRSIFCNLRKSMGYIISIHVPIAGLALFPVIFEWPILLMPIHIVLLEVFIDPVSTLLFESQEPEEDLMRRLPRRPKTNLFSFSDLLRCGFEGLMILLPALYLYQQELGVHRDADQARALVFLSLGLCNIGLIMADLTNGKPKEMQRFWGRRSGALVLSCLLASLLLLTSVEKLARLFHFQALNFADIAMAILFSVIFFSLTSLWNAHGGLLWRKALGISNAS